MKNKQESNAKIIHENVVKQYETTDNLPSEMEYAESKAFLECYFDKKTQGAILRSKSEFYEQNEKSSKYFLNLEKRIGENITVKKLVKGNIELTESKDILNELHEFYSNLFNRKILKTNSDCKNFLGNIYLPNWISINKFVTNSLLSKILKIRFSQCQLVNLLETMA